MEVVLTISGWTLFIVALFILLYALYTEKVWQSRVNIQYSNFQQKSQHFQVKPKIWFLYIIFIDALLTIIYILIVFPNAVLNVYMYLVLIGFAFVILSLYLIVSRVGKNKDLTVIHALYEKIKHTYTDLNQIEIEYNKAKDLNEKFIKNNQAIEDKYKSIIAGKVNLDLSVTLTKLADVINEYDSILHGFDNLLSSKFNTILMTYLKRGQIEYLDINQLNSGSYNLDQLKHNIIEEQKTLIKSYSLSILENKMIVQSEEMIQLISYLEALDIEFSSAFIEQFIHFSNLHEDIRDYIVLKFEPKNALSYDFIKECIMKYEYDWLLYYDYKNNLDNRSLTEISTYLIDKDKNNIVLDFLLTLNKSKYEFLPILLSTIQTRNISYNYFNTFYSMRIKSYQLHDALSKRTENIFILLSQFANDYHDESLKKELEDIDMTVVFEENDKMISDLYNVQINRYRPLFEYSFQIVFTWLNSKHSSQLFDEKKVLEVIDEYKNNLQLEELKRIILVLIVDILENNDSATQQKVCIDTLIELNIDAIPVVKNLTLNQKQRLDLVHQLYRMLILPKVRNTTIAILNRVENERLLMKKYDDMRVGS